MNDEYTPDVESVKLRYMVVSHLRDTADSAAEFDRWLTTHDAEVKAAAWDEGWNTGWDGRMLHDAGIEGHAEATNPYRKAAPNE